MTGAQAGSAIAGSVETGSNATGSSHTGVSATAGSSFGAAGISAKLSITSAGFSMICWSPTELNSATTVIGSETVSRSKSEITGFSGSGTISEIGSTNDVSTGSAFGCTSGARGTKFSTAAPIVVAPPFGPKGRF